MTDSLNILEDNDIQTINLDLDLGTSTNNDSLGIELLADPKKTAKTDGYGRKGTAINFVTSEDIDHMNEIQKFYNTKIDEMPQNLADYL